MLEELNFKFGIPEALTFLAGNGGFQKALLRHQNGSEAEVYLYGAHVTGWQTRQHGELLYLSERAEYVAGKAIRGGIPLIFPQFGGGPLPSHGFARNNMWNIMKSGVTADGTVELSLGFEDSEKLRAVWPHRFSVEYTVSLNDALATSVTITNRGEAPFLFQFALHTYFSVGEIEGVEIPRLKDLTYLDNLEDRKECKEESAKLRFDREIDRIYLNAPAQLRIDDSSLRRSMVIDREGFKDAVVWNPWIEKTKRLSDMNENDYSKMVCLESGTMVPPQELPAGDSITWRQRLSVV